MSVELDFAVVFATILLLTILSALCTSLWLGWHSRFQPVLKPLAGFSAMMAIWCGGHLALQLEKVQLGAALVLANPLMPTFFLVFALQYLKDKPQPRWLGVLQKTTHLWLGLSTAIVLLSWYYPSYAVVRLHQIQDFFVFSGFGWFNLVYTVAVGVLAHAVLWWGSAAYEGTKRFSILALFMTAGLGLLLATSFVFPSFGLDWYPWPMLLLPAYLVLMVYSVVRYQLLAVNAFASRALGYLVMAFLLLILVGLISALFGQLGMPALTAVPGYQLWLYSTLLLVLAAAAYQPASALAERLIYPGVQLNPQMLQQWQQQLSAAKDWQELAEQAAALIAQPLKQPMQLSIWQAQQCLAQTASRSGLTLSFHADAPQQWSFRCEGDSTLTPTLRLTLDVFASLVLSRCERLQAALALAEVQKQQLAQQHLVELGALAAAMAHELRNPLNIISMASAGVDAELRGHIQTQLKRADRLIADMLVYAGKLTVQPQWFPLKPLVESLLKQPPMGVRVQIDIPDTLQLHADPYRVQQVLQNLIDNAWAFLTIAEAGAAPCLQISASVLDINKSGRVQLRVQNNGPKIDESLMAGQLFRPFISKRPGGSGLGLAIVQRILQAHGGQIVHQTSAEWPVAFVMDFAGELA